MYIYFFLLYIFIFYLLFSHIRCISYYYIDGYIHGFFIFYEWLMRYFKPDNEEMILYQTAYSLIYFVFSYSQTIRPRFATPAR